MRPTVYGKPHFCLLNLGPKLSTMQQSLIFRRRTWGFGVQASAKMIVRVHRGISGMVDNSIFKALYRIARYNHNHIY